MNSRRITSCSSWDLCPHRLPFDYRSAPARKGVLQEAFDRIQHERAAQITLVSIIGATRIREHCKGRTQRTVCGGCKVQPDSFEHLSRYYNLTDLLKVGMESTEFLVMLA